MSSRGLAAAPSLVAVGQPEMRRHNRARALGVVWDRGRITRTELARTLGLTKPAVTRIVQELTEAGYLIEGDVERSSGRGGRPGTYLAFAGGRHSFVGIDLRAYRGKVQVRDLDGTLLHETLLDIGPEVDPDTTVRRVVDVLSALGASIPPVRGIGVSIPGRLKPDQRTLDRAVRWRWADYPLGERLAEALGPGWPEPQIHHLSGCGAIGNLRHHPNDPAGTTLMHVQVGLGAGLGRVTQSVGSVLLDLRYVDIAHLPMQADGPRCSCGAHGCLDAVAGFAPLARLAAPTGLEVVEGPTAIDDFCRSLADLAVRGDPAAVSAVETVATHLGRAVAMINNVDPPDLFSIGGYPALLGPVFDVAFLAAVEPHAPGVPQKLVHDTLGDEASVAGSIALGMTAAFADPLAGLEPRKETTA